MREPALLSRVEDVLPEVALLVETVDVLVPASELRVAEDEDLPKLAVEALPTVLAELAL